MHIRLVTILDHIAALKRLLQAMSEHQHPATPCIHCSRPPAGLLFGSKAMQAVGIELAPSRHEPSDSTTGTAPTTTQYSFVYGSREPNLSCMSPLRFGWL